MPLSNKRIELAFQKTFTASGDCFGGEFLCREIIDGEGRPPVSLLGFVNDNNLHVQFDRIIITKALLNIKELYAQHPKGRFHINIHPKSFTLADFSSWVIDVTDKHGVDSLLVTPEITEYSCELDLYLFREPVINLKEHRFNITLDDLGCERSNLEDLIVMHPFIDSIKLASVIFRKRHFFKKIISGLSILAPRISIIAECIEDEETVAYLKNCGFNIHQGYLHYKPESYIHTPA